MLNMSSFLNKEVIYSGSLIIILFLLEYVYLRLARKHSIFDTENERSSHSGNTIIGGGIIFMLSFFIYSIFFNFPYPNLLIGAFILALVSFIDDLGYVKYSYRLLSHLVALTLILPYLDLSSRGYFFIFAIVILGVGVLNSFNFIDGINGMLGAVSMVILMSLFYLNLGLNFTDTNFIIAIILGVVVFLFFNFRNNPVCFAGDVGSIVIGYFIFIFIVNLCFFTSDYYYLLLMGIPGAEAGLTLLFRILNNQNILMPHRTFLFHFLVHEARLSHLGVSAIYAFFQLLLCLLVIITSKLDPGIKLTIFISLVSILTILYLYFRKKYYNIIITIVKF
jgi:UDP-N-acetylmuramyl pentapeptide phosphotransferase/UDP-N-acetylglucosamine-1-phosphate transferase